MNLKRTKILFFIVGVLLLQGLFTIELTTKGPKIKFFITGILLRKGSLYRGFSVTLKLISNRLSVESGWLVGLPNILYLRIAQGGAIT
jgi:hypothetical protein